MQYLLFYAEIIDKNRKNRAYADLGHITAWRRKEESSNYFLFTKKDEGQGHPYPYQSLVALMDKDEKEALFKAADEEGF